jgi:hypothetical protein
MTVHAGKRSSGGCSNSGQIVGGFARTAQHEHRRTAAEELRAALQQHVTRKRRELHGSFPGGGAERNGTSPLSRHASMINLSCKHIVPHLNSSLRVQSKPETASQTTEHTLTLEIVDLPGKLHVRRQQIGDNFGDVIEKMLSKKLLKLVKSAAGKRVLLPETTAYEPPTEENARRDREAAG